MIEDLKAELRMVEEAIYAIERLARRKGRRPRVPSAAKGQGSRPPKTRQSKKSSGNS